MQSATIKLFLVTGSPNGLRTAELSNWSGKALAAPRTQLSELLKRPELDGPGVYILNGEDAATTEAAVYIGEAESIAKRLKQHGSKEFWSSATVFVSKDENLTKAHVRYLEGRLMERAYEAGRVSVLNTVSSGAKLPESDAAEMEVYFQKCLQLLPVLGVSAFVVSERSQSDVDTLYCDIKGLRASGRRTETGFVVFKGSQAVGQHRKSAKSIRKLRERLMASGLLDPVDDHLVFTRDHEFGSPSTAGGVVRGGNTNGLIQWKDKSGRSLKELESR